MKTRSLIFIILLIGPVGTLPAQERNPAPAFDSFHKNIYVEALGGNLLVGVNYDMRLQRGRMDGIGFRVGIGGLGVSNPDFSLWLISFPLEFNHLLGKRRSSFEAGIGLLPIYATVSGKDENYKYVREGGIGFAGGYATLGYRFQPLRNGPMFRIVWNPLILRGNGFYAGWIGVGLGVGFK